MAFVEFLYALYALDFGFLLQAFQNNIFWIFGLIAAGYYFSDRKSLFFMGFTYLVLIIFTMDIFTIVHFTVYTATGLFFLYLARLSVLILLENTKTAKHLIPLGYVMAFFVTLFVDSLGWV